MAQTWIDALAAASETLWRAAAGLVVPALAAIIIAFIAHGADAARKARAAGGEVRVNLWLYAFDSLFVGPGLALAAAALGLAVAAAGLDFGAPLWLNAPIWLTVLAAIFIGDFVGYWRHRFEHSALLWSAHAIHHSDTAMTWTTLLRFHPINRASTVLIDTVTLALLGFPPWALAANWAVRHYWGLFIHMDLPWTLGPLGHVLVSPAMHRWHHTREGAGVGANFATVLSVFDRAFGTLHAPGPCDAPLGVTEHIPGGATGHLLYPLKVAVRAVKTRVAMATASKPAIAGANPTS